MQFPDPQCFLYNAVITVKRNEGLSFSDAIQKSIEMIAIYDENGDAELDRDEFTGKKALMLLLLSVKL